MINELDLVVLTHDFPEHGLQRGDVGNVVHRYQDGQAFEVEFVTAAGATVAVLTLERTDVRPVDGREILHVRDLATASA
jgi:hypothetical protein